MAPQPAQAGFGPGVSTTISPPPVESLNLDQFLNLSEGKRLQRARAGRNQVKRLLGELQMTPSEMRILQQELEEQVSLLSVLHSSPKKKSVRLRANLLLSVCTQARTHTNNVAGGAAQKTRETFDVRVRENDRRGQERGTVREADRKGSGAREAKGGGCI